MHIKHEASHRHGRVTAVGHQFVPVMVAQLGHIHAERRQEVLSVARGKPTLAQREPQRHRFRDFVVSAQKAGLQPIEQLELLLWSEPGVVGHVVGDPYELVERQNDAAMTRVNEPRRDRKVLVAMALSGPQGGRVVGHSAVSLAGYPDIKRNAAPIATLMPLRWR